MDLHLPLVCAVTNARWLEYIPQLDEITRSGIHIEEGHAAPPDEPGLGIDWDWDAIGACAALRETIS